MMLLIVADDLTGAADSAARCHSVGLPATVILEVATPLPAGAVALSTDSRFLPAAAAAQRVRDLLTPLVKSETIWYKKIDSTLRGNIGAELDAMLATLAAGLAVAVICPAFPAQGRGLVNGRLTLARASGDTPRLVDLLAAQSGRRVVEIGLATVRAGVSALAAKLHSHVNGGAQFLVVDALNDNDLTTLVAASRLALPNALLAGSAGLIEPLARTLAQNAAGAQRAPASATKLRRPLLFVVGSGSEMAHQQLAALRAQPNLHVTTFGPDWAYAYPDDPHGVAIHLPKPSRETVLEGQSARAMAARLAEAAAGLIADLRPQTLVVVGGDTTVELLQRLHIRRLTVLAELMAGMPLLQGVDDQGTAYQIVTKAGSFGDAGTLVALLEQAQPAK